MTNGNIIPQAAATRLFRVFSTLLSTSSLPLAAAAAAAAAAATTTSTSTATCILSDTTTTNAVTSEIVAAGANATTAVPAVSSLSRFLSFVANKHRLLLLDHQLLALLSPRTWYGILQSQTHSVFNEFDAIQLLQAALAILLPFFILTYAFHYHCGSIRQKDLGVRNVLMAPVLLSPWTLTAVVHCIQQIRHLLPPLARYVTARMEALPSAHQAIHRAVMEGRATRHGRYDIYWPPPPPPPLSTKTNNTANLPLSIDSIPTTATKPSLVKDVIPSSPSSTPASTSIVKAILLLPGYGIAHVAYAEVARRFADAGFVVVVVSMEPLRVAHKHLGADVQSMTRICRRVEQEYYDRIMVEIAPAVSSTTTTTTFQWNLLGHSAGSFAAMHLYQQFLTRQRKALSSFADRNDTTTSSSFSNCNGSVIQVDKLVLWGCAAMVGMATDLSNLFVVGSGNDNISEPKILLVQATQDALVEQMKPFQDSFDNLFPLPGTRTVTQWISGTHQGFGSYKSTWSGSPDLGDAAATIPYAEQQRQACEDWTIPFLLGDKSNSEDHDTTRV